MTWIMFDNKILHPESGAYFKLKKTEKYISIHKPTEVEISIYYTNNTVLFSEDFVSELEAQQRFEELKQLLIRKPEDVEFELVGNSYKDYLNKGGE